MYPHERSLVAELQQKPFAIVGVNSDPDLDKLKPRLAAEQITWRSFGNGPEGTRGPIAKAWHVVGWPTIYVIDHLGVIRYKGHGNPREPMDRAIEAAVAAAERAAGR